MHRIWLFIDLDPKRPAGIAASDAEHDAALERARAVRERLRTVPWPDPILIDSGNGAYLLYRIDLPNDADALALVSGVLEGIASEFSDDVVMIDTTVSNAARIMRIPGTMNCKGDDTPDRPHRRAALLDEPAELVPVPVELLQLVAAWAPKADPAPRRPNSDGRAVDLDAFVHEHGLVVQLDTRNWRPGCRRVRLAICPFNSSHTDGSAALFQFASGAVAFRCLHNGCHGRGWRECREHLEGVAPRKFEAPAEITPPGAVRDLADLLAEVASFLKRYVVFAGPMIQIQKAKIRAQLVAVTLWVAMTHVFNEFDTTPYLSITSPEKRSGKSRLLDALALIVARAWLVVRPSEAVVYRKIQQDSPTLLLDEVDTIYRERGNEHEGLRAALNAGHRRGATVPRCVGDGRNQTVMDFSVFGPKALAGIGGLPDTVADRSIPIRLRRRARAEKVSKFRYRDVSKVAAMLQQDLAAWAARAKFSNALPDPPPALDDRAADGWESLLAIADAAGGGWSQLARGAAVALHAEVDDESTGSLGVRLLEDIRGVFGTNETLFTSQIIDGLIALDEAPWGEFGRDRKPLSKSGLARLLRPYGIRPAGTVRIGHVTAKGYVRSSFEETWDRYLDPLQPPASPVSASEPSHRHNGTESTSCTDSDPSHDHLRNEHPSHKEPQEKQRVAAKCDGVTGANPERDDWRVAPLAVGGEEWVAWQARAGVLEADGMSRDDAELWAAHQLGLLLPPAGSVQ